MAYEVEKTPNEEVSGSVPGGVLKTPKATKILFGGAISLFVAVVAIAGVLLAVNQAPHGVPIGAYGYTNPFVFLYGRASGTPSFYTDSVTIAAGQSIDLYWQAGNVDYCKAGPKPWTSFTGLASPVVVVGPITQGVTYTVECYQKSSATPIAKSQIQVFVQSGGYGYNSIVASIAASSPSGYVAAGSANVPLFKFNLSTPATQSYALGRMNVEFGGSLSVASLANLRLIDDQTGAVVASYPILKQSMTFFVNGLVLAPGSTRSFTVTADVSKKALKSTLFVRLNDLYLEEPPIPAPTTGLPVVGNLLGIEPVSTQPIVTGPLSVSAVIGKVYQPLATYQVSGGSEPYSWKTRGSLPPGLQLVAPTRPIPVGYGFIDIVGTPTKVGTYNFSIIATDAGGHSATIDVTVTVALKSGK